MTPINTKNAPQALGHYEQAITHDGLVYISGQLPLDPQDDTLPIGDIRQQTQQVLKNLDAILKAANSDKTKVLNVTLYITDINDWPTINEVYANYFGTHKPARAAVPIVTLPKGCHIEVSATAAQLA